MKKSFRIFIIVFLIGLSLLVVTVMRTFSIPRTMNFGNEEEGATRGWIMYSDFLLFPRDFRTEIRANNTVEVYILDEVATRQWNTNKALNPTWTYKDVDQGSFSEHADYRGAYAILVHLPENDTTIIKVTLNFSGFEKDLLATSLAIIAVDIIAINISLALNHGKNKKN